MLHNLKKGDRVRVVDAPPLARYRNISPGMEGVVKDADTILVVVDFEDEDAIEASFMSATEAGLCLQRIT